MLDSIKSIASHLPQAGVARWERAHALKHRKKLKATQKKTKSKGWEREHVQAQLGFWGRGAPKVASR